MKREIKDIERIEAGEDKKILISLTSERLVIEADYIEFDHSKGTITIYEY